MADNRQRTILFEYGNDAVIKIEGKYITDYVVARGFYGIDKDWDHGVYFSATAGDKENELACYMWAIEYLYKEANKDYITYDRMTEIATKFKDGMIDFYVDREDALDWMRCEMDLTENEIEFFGLNEDEEIF